MRGLWERRHAPTVAAVVGLALTLTLPAVGGTDASQQAEVVLKGRQAELGSRAHAALMSLYALDSRLVLARNRLASLRARLVATRAEQKRVAQDETIARVAWKDSANALASRLRAIYEHDGDQDALAVLLGASSIDEAVSRLDAMRWSARLNQQTIEQTRAAGRTLARLRVQLESRIETLRTLESQAAHTVAALSNARAQKLAYVASLSRQRTFTAKRIARLSASAQRISVRSQAIAAQQEPVQVSAPLPAPTGKTITVTATGYSMLGHTATGMPVGWGVVAVDPSVIPLGTRLTIPGYGEGVAADTGGAVQGATIDLWFPTPAQALAWGRQTVAVTLH